MTKRVIVMYKNTGIKNRIIDEIIDIAKECEVDIIYLFGSRARGDYRERSDIDLAFSGKHATDFILRVDEETSTLLQFDIVDLKCPIQKELLDSIYMEGIKIYEKV